MNKLAAVGVLVSVGSFAFGCGGAGPLDRPSDTAVDASAVGKNRCTAEGDEQRLFVVDWDATDLAAFESRAGRDVVFVKYEGCKVQILQGCSDDGIAGRYGTYNKAIATSGTVESLVVKDTDELYAKLPLGAATFGTEVSRGKALDLSYFVSGTVNATRDSVYKGDLSSQDRCAQATHFVSSYALGAFKLASVDKASLGASASAAGFGGGGKTTSEAASLKKGGDMTSCTSLDPHGCRVPIRLTLRPLSNGAAPTAAAAPPTEAQAASGQNAALANASGMMDAMKLRMSAEQKLMGGDAQGCLIDIDRAAAASPQLVDAQVHMLRAKCEMRAGKCDEGKKHYKEAKAAWARDMKKQAGNAGGGVLDNEASIAHEADQLAGQFCPSATTGGAPPTMAMVMTLQKIQQSAAAKDTASCIKDGDALTKAIKANPNDPMAKMAAGGIQSAAVCAGDGGKCADARRLYKDFLDLFMPGTDKSGFEAAFKDAVPACTGK